MTPSPNPFQRPTAPKNGLELLKWVIFEPVVFDRFSNSLSGKQAVAWYLRICFWIMLGATIPLF